MSVSLPQVVLVAGTLAAAEEATAMAVAAVAVGLRAVAVTEAAEKVAAAWVEAEGGTAAATRVATVPAAGPRQPHIVGTVRAFDVRHRGSE